MAINLNDNINTLAPKPIDNRYGPYASLANAINAISSSARHTGLTVGIGSPVVEYWWRNGLSDNDLTVKNEAVIDVSNLSNVVLTTGNQNIGGVKTFLTAPIFSSGYSNGQLLIGSGTSLVPNTLTAGTGIYIDTSSSGNIKINVTGLPSSALSYFSGEGGIDIFYYSVYDRYIISSTGLSYVGHKHLFEDINLISDINLSGYRITNLGSPVSNNDAVTKSYMFNAFDTNDFSVSNNVVNIKNNYIQLGTTQINLGSPKSVIGGLDLDGGSP